MNTEALFFAGALAIAGGAALSQLSGDRASLGAAAASIAVNQVAAEVAAEAAAAEAALAESRYDSGLCLRSETPITRGLAVPRELSGAIVCDPWGSTAVVARDGRLTLIARTGNPEAIAGGLR